MESLPPFRCAVCGMQFDEVIANFESGALAHYSDREFPGRCVIAVHEHAEKLEELSPEKLTRLMLDVQRAGRAIRAVTGAPHIHVHLIPRGAPSDRHGTDTPWGPPPRTEPLAADEAQRLRRGIAKALE